MTEFVALYLKLNILLLAAGLFWLATRHLASRAGFAVSHGRQLVLARGIFLAVLLLLPLLQILNALRPEVLGGLSGAVLAGSMTVASDMDVGLSRQFLLAGAQWPLALLMLAALGVGLGARLMVFMGQWRELRAMVGEGIVLRRIHGVHILFSPRASAPFSTRALGKKHVILPYRLLHQPDHLRLAVKHELQHLRNGDLAWVLGLEALRVLCFWNPATRFWHNEFHCLQELACDEALVTRRGVSPAAYGNCLLEVASGAAGKAPLAASNMVPYFSLFGKSHLQLKRRILMLNRKNSSRFTPLKTLAYGLLAGSGLAASSLMVMAQDEADDSGARKEYLPVSTIAPKYPTEAFRNNLVGWVQWRFTVTEEGAVEDPQLEDSCVDGRGDYATTEEGCIIEYADIFHEPSREALERFTFDPRMVDGEPQATQGVQYVFTFRLSEESQGAPGQPSPRR